MNETPEVVPDEQPVEAPDAESAPADDENTETATDETAAETGEDAGAERQAKDGDEQGKTAGDDAATEPSDDGGGNAEASTDEQPAASHEISPEQVVESLLFASERPLTIQKITAMLGTGTARDVRDHIKTLNKRYEKTNASFRIEQLAGGFQMLTLPAFNTWISKLKQSKQDSKLSQAAMETLALVAYKQPVLRADIEAVRGVASGEMLNRLRELNLIKIVGRAEELGRPMLYGTTKRFLEVFGLSGLDDLPEVEELQPPSQ
jgi:segregation and condensation protein B